MLSEDQVQRTKGSLRELFELWDLRSESYGEVVFGSAVIKENGNWRNLFTYFLPLHAGEVRESKTSAEYNDFRVLAGRCSLGDAKEVFAKVVESNELSVPGVPVVPLEASLYPGSSRFCTSHGSWFPVRYPCVEYHWSIASEFQGDLPQRTICSVNHPIYPGGREAIEDLLHVQLGGRSGRCGELIALAPDYRGRLREVRLSAGGVEVQIDCPPGADRSDLLGKVYFEAPSGKRRQQRLMFTDGRAAFEAETFPRTLIAVLLSGSTGDLIDENGFLAGYHYAASGVVVETTAQSIENLILGGESETVEFKRELPKRGEELAVSISSFLNRHGGQILIGIEDDGRVVGFESRGAPDSITNIVNDLCDPPIHVTIDTAAVGGKQIVVVTVPEGKDKPCIVKGKGPYVRSGATSRPATRYELDQMYHGKEGGKKLLEL